MMPWSDMIRHASISSGQQCADSQTVAISWYQSRGERGAPAPTRRHSDGSDDRTLSGRDSGTLRPGRQQTNYRFLTPSLFQAKTEDRWLLPRVNLSTIIGHEYKTLQTLQSMCYQSQTGKNTVKSSQAHNLKFKWDWGDTKMTWATTPQHHPIGPFQAEKIEFKNFNLHFKIIYRSSFYL